MTFTCDRCKKPVDQLWEVSFLFEELVLGDRNDGQTGEVTAQVCEGCTDELDQLLARECGKPDPYPKKAKGKPAKAANVITTKVTP